MDEFTINRFLKILKTFKKSHGRDISESEVKELGIPMQLVDHLVRKGVVDKYQVTSGKGNRENRFKLYRDPLTLRDP